MDGNILVEDDIASVVKFLPKLKNKWILLSKFRDVVIEHDKWALSNYLVLNRVLKWAVVKNGGNCWNSWNWLYVIFESPMHLVQKHL